MRLSAVLNCATKPITVKDLIVNYLFNGKPPTEFHEGNVYNKNDLVYVILDNGDIIIKQCLVTKQYDDLNDLDLIIPNIQDITSGNPDEIFKNSVTITNNINLNAHGIVCIEPVNIHKIDFDKLINKEIEVV